MTTTAELLDAILRERCSPGDTIAGLIESAIDLYAEYIEKHGYEPEDAKATAVAEVLDSLEVNMTKLEREARARGDELPL
jgi:hypothetical protein